MSLPEFLSFRSKNYALVFRIVEGQPVKIYDGRIDEDAIEKAKEESRSIQTYPNDVNLYPPGILSSFGRSDYRESLVHLKDRDGFFTFRFSLTSIEEVASLVQSDEFPHTRNKKTTTCLHYLDESGRVSIAQFLTVYPEEDTFVTHLSIRNVGNEEIRIERAFSLQDDLGNEEYEIRTFTGAWGRERQVTVNEIHQGIFENSSVCGASSSYRNPAILLSRKSGGDYHLANLVYSGNHKELVQNDHNGGTRLLVGMSDFMMDIPLAPGEFFDTPEATLTRGATLNEVKISSNRFIRRHILPEANEIPIIFNSWEAYEFDLRSSNLPKCAHLAARAGAQLFVFDDGWYGKRQNVDTSLGDWVLNRDRYPSFEFMRGELSKHGLKFGLWLEPEMVSQNSDFYREHPEYALQIPGITPVLQRNQLILDFSSPEVVDAVFARLCALFDDAKPDYVKWDMNRLVTDVFSRSVKGGAFFHEFQKGLYRLLSRIRARYPRILFEGCASGGARFDLGMLYYFPFIWTSDCTDVRKRLSIQEGTNLVYPLCTLSNHVSGIPNQQTKQKSSPEDRINVACFGRYGYELNLLELPSAEIATFKKGSLWYKKHAAFLKDADVFLGENNPSHIVSWNAVKEDKTAAIALLGSTDRKGTKIVKVAGLAQDGLYEISFRPQENADGEVFPPITGKDLAERGITIAHFFMESDAECNEVGIATRIALFKRIG